VRILFTHCDNLYRSFLLTLSTVPIPTVDLSTEARLEQNAAHIQLSPLDNNRTREQRERENIPRYITVLFFPVCCQTNTRKNQSIDDGVPTVSHSLMCAPTMRFVVMLLPLLLMLHLLRPKNDAVCVGLCASAAVVIGARACPHQECCPQPQGIVCDMPRVCHLVNRACRPFRLLGTLSCFTSSFVPPFNDNHLACRSSYHTMTNLSYSTLYSRD
jgi:hypothetical protein